MVEYSLDSRGGVLRTLKAQPEKILGDPESMIKPDSEAKFIAAACDLLIPQPPSPEDIPRANLSKMAFWGGAVVAVHSFFKSTIEPLTITKTMVELTYRGMPEELHELDEETRLAQVEQMSEETFAAHEEVSEHKLIINKYYTAAAQNIEIGLLSATGLGFTLSVLDRCYFSVVTHNNFGRSVNSVNWDAEFQKITGSPE